MVKKTLVIVLAVVGLVSLFTYREAGAVANGDGICSPSEEANFDCGKFGSNVIEFRGARPIVRDVDINGDIIGVPATIYLYLYTPGTETMNQLNVAIPLRLNKVVNDALEINCSQYITNGSGDPTTGFGKGLFTVGICRTAPNLSVNPIIPDNPGNWNFFLVTDPSSFDKAMPLDWQMKAGKSIYSKLIVGPVAAQAPVAETGATLTSGNKTISYTVQGGEVTIASGDATTVPIDKTKLCLPTLENQRATFTGLDGIDYTCETISYVTDQADIKTTGGDPCRYIGGYCIRY